MDMPGAKKEDVNLDVDDAKCCVTVTVDKKMHEMGEEKREKGEGWLIRERTMGKLQRVIIFPENADLQKADVCLFDGVLCFKVPKRELPHARKLAIK